MKKDTERLICGLTWLHKVSLRRRGKADRSFRKARSFRKRIHLELSAKGVPHTQRHTYQRKVKNDLMKNVKEMVKHKIM